MYKGKRYNTLIVCLLLVISIVVGFSAGMSKNSSASTDSGWEEEIPDDLLPDDNDIVTETPVSGIPGADANAFERLTFAIEILHNGAGFTSYLNQNLVILGNTQYMFYKKYRGGGLDLTEEWYKFNAIVSFLESLGKHDFRSYYSDGTNMKYKYIDNTNYFNYDARTYNYDANYNVTDFSAQHYEKDENRTKLNNFYTTINENTCTIDKYDKKTDPNNYIIRVNINQSKLDSQYIGTFIGNGATDLNIKTETITFKINKKTGCLASYEKYEVFTATSGGLRNVEAVVNLKETYLTMNRSAESTIRNIVLQSFGI